MERELCRYALHTFIVNWLQIHSVLQFEAEGGLLLQLFQNEKQRLRQFASRKTKFRKI